MTSTTIIIIVGKILIQNTQLHNYWMLQVEITLLFSQLVFMFFLRVCTGAYATFSRSTVAVVQSITVSYSGPGSACCAGRLDCVSPRPVSPSGDALEDRLCL